MTPTATLLPKTVLEEMVRLKEVVESERKIDDSIVQHITEMLNTFNKTFEKSLFNDEEIFKCVRYFLDFLSFTLQGISYFVFKIWQKLNLVKCPVLMRVKF